MTEQEAKINKLKELFKIVDESITRKEFIDSFQNVVNLVLRTEKTLTEKHDKNIASLKELFGTLDSQIKTSTDAEVSGTLKELKSTVAKMLKEQETGMNMVRDKLRNLKSGKDGKPADETKIISKVLKEIPKQKDIVLDTAEELRNKLESLTGEERLDWEAIRGLSEELDTLRVSKLGGGGGFSKIALEIHILDPYLPTGDINGVNTDFVLKKIPNPDTSLKVYLGGQLQSLTGDYTLSSKTITFTSKIPQTGETLLVEHRA